MSPPPIVLASLFTALALAGASVAVAHGGATGIVKERMEAMKAIAEQMKTIGAMVKGEARFDGPTAAAAAKAIARSGGKIGALFPEGSNHPPSEARGLIWQEWNDFSRLASRLEEAALALSAKAGSAADSIEIRAEFGALGKACKSCHEKYRIEKP